MPLATAAQEADDFLCISVGGDGIFAQVALYGSDNTALVMAIPPDGETVPMESYVVSLPSDAFPNMVAVLRPGLAELPAPPDEGACADDTLGPVSIALRQNGAETLRYDALCPTAAVLDLNDALIAATGDPAGDEMDRWTGPTIPAMRDICRTIP